MNTRRPSGAAGPSWRKFTDDDWERRLRDERDADERDGDAPVDDRGWWVWVVMWFLIAIDIGMVAAWQFALHYPWVHS